MNTLLLIFLAPFLTSTAVGQIESVQAQTPFLETAALKFYCRFGSVLNQDTSHCSPVVEEVQEQPPQTVQEKVVEVVRNVFVPTASAQEVPSSSYLEAMIRRIVLELLPTQQVVQGPKGDKGDAGVGGTQALTLLDTPVTFWSGGGGSVSTGGSTVINNITNIVGTTSTSSLSLQDAYDFGGAGLGKAIDTTAGGAVEITVQDGAGLFNGLTIVGDVNATEGMLFTKYDLGVGGQHAGFGFFDDISNPLAASGMIAGYSFPSNRFSLALRTGGVGAHDLVLANPLTDLAGTTLQNYTGTPNVLALASAGLGSIVQNVGLGNPENVVTADSGSIYFRVDGVGASQQLYVKTGDGTNTGWVALGAGATSSVAWELGGNVGTNSDINFLGTTDNVDLVFKTNNATSGVISADGLSFAFGPGAGAGGASRLDTNFFGFNAGNGATGGASLNFFGRNAGNGATNATEVNFFGDNAGNGAINVVASNFFGTNAGQTATNASDSNFFGTNAGSGATSANNSNFFGPDAGANSINAANSNFFGISAGNNAVDASDANFFGANAGNGASSAVGSNFFGVNAGNGATGASFSNFFGAVSGLGATGASNSNFFGTAAGINAVSAANSNFFGANAGDTADTAFNSNFFGTNAGYQATNASDSNFFGTNAGYQATNSISSNFFGNGAGYQSTFANESNFFGLNAGYQAVNANNSRFFGTNAGYQATNANNSSFFGNNAGNSATGASNSNFFGTNAGASATDAYASNFFGASAGQSATNANVSNFFGVNAGYQATNADASNFFGPDAGSIATNANRSNFFGDSAGQDAINAAFSNFFGYQAGEGAINAANSIFIGRHSGFNDMVDNTISGNSILIGDYTSTGGFSDSIALGTSATNTASNQLYIRDAITNFNFAGVNYIFPTTQGATGTVLTNNGTGVLSWVTVATTSTSTLLTADNGLTINPANNIQLGGRLLQNTSIETNDGFAGFFFEVGPNAGEPLFRVDNASNTATLGDASNWTGGTSITADITNRQLRFTTADAGFVPQERMRIDGNGFVGIGTSTPTERLDVSGNIRFSGALMPNNLAGASGTVLISQGTGLAPLWGFPVVQIATIVNSNVAVSTVLTGTDDQFQGVNTTGGTRTITLPAAANREGQMITIFKTASPNQIDVDRTGGDSINFAPSTYTIRKQTERVTFVSDGLNNWQTIAQDGDFVGTDGVTAGERGLVPTPAIGDLGKILSANGTWVATSSLFSISSSTIASNSGFIQNGNSFGTTGILGTNDNFALSFETNNVTQATLATDGQLQLPNTVSDRRKIIITNGAGGDTNYIRFDGANADVSIGVDNTDAGRNFGAYDDTTGTSLFRFGFSSSTNIQSGHIGNSSSISTRWDYITGNHGTIRTLSNSVGKWGVFDVTPSLYRFVIEPDNTLTVGQTPNYESLVTSDNDIPNRKFITDLFAQNIIQNGNSFGTTTVIGTNDNQPLVFKTNNINKVTVGTNGATSIDSTANGVLTLNGLGGNTAIVLNNGVTSASVSLSAPAIGTFRSRNVTLDSNIIEANNSSVTLGSLAAPSYVMTMNSSSGTTTMGVNGTRKWFVGDNVGIVRLFVRPSNVLATETVGYESLVTSDNDIPNRKFVTDLFAQNIVQNGNSFGTTTVIGTNDLQDFSFETNNTQRVNFRADNQFGLELFNTDTLNRYAYAIRNTTNNLNYSLWDGATQDWLLGFNDNQFLVLDRTDNRDMMRITKSGGVYTTVIGDPTTPSGNVITLSNNNVGYGNTTFGINSTRKFFVSDGSVVRFWVKPSNVLAVDTVGYESLVAADNDIPNRRFVFNNFFAQNGNAFGALATIGTTDNNALRFIASTTEAMRVATSGFIGIGNTSPLLLLHTGSSSITSGTTVARFENAGGTCDVTPNVAGGITCTSDQNLKKDIEAIDPIDSLQKLLEVEVKSYRMNADASTSAKQTGFLAQQLETQFPGLVLTSIEGTKSVSYAGMTPILTQAIQTLYKFMSDIGVVVEGGVARIGDFVASKVETDELCVGSVCVTESQFLQMVQNAQIVQQIESTQVSEVTSPQDNTSSTTIPVVVEEVVVSGDQIVDENNVSPVIETITQPDEIVSEPTTVSDSVQNSGIVTPEI